MIRRLFLDHPRAVGETYGQHQQVALSYALPLIGAGLACLVHAFVPGLFLKTGSRTVTRLHDRMTRRASQPEATATAPEFSVVAAQG